MVKRKYKPVQSLQRGIALLERLSEKPDGASLKDLASHVETSTAAVYHLIHTLVEKGYAQRIEDPVRYVLGERWLAVATGQASDHFTSVVCDEMLKIARSLPGVGVHFSEDVAGSIVLSSHINSTQPELIRRDSRHVLPPYVTGGSLAHLAFWPDEIVDDYENRYPFDHYGLPLWRTRNAYEQAMESLRANGYLLMPEDSPLKLKLVLPVLRAGGSIAGAITLQWNQNREETVSDAKRQLVATALSVNASLCERFS